MNINQKAIRLLQQIVNGRKEYCNGHFVYKPQLEADVVNKLYAEFLSKTTSQPVVTPNFK